MFPRRDEPASALSGPHTFRMTSGGGVARNRETAQAPYVSILVPVRNEAGFIETTLSQLLKQNYSPSRYEVIVADGGSEDNTAAIVQQLQLRHANLHLVANPGRWSSAGRNAALELSRGDLIVVVDGHCQIDSGEYLNKLVDAFERSGADCIGRPQPLDVSQATTLQRTIAAARSSRFGHHPDSHIYSNEEKFVPPQSVAVAYRREVFETIGTFNERFDACEDVEFNHRVDRAGLICYFTPAVAVRYHPRATLKGLFRQMIRYGRGRVRLLREHPDTFTIMGFMPALFLLGLLVGPVCSLISNWLALFYVSCVAMYAGLLVATSAMLAQRTRNISVLGFSLLVFPAIHLGAGLGILLEVIRPGKACVSQENRVTKQTVLQKKRAA